MSYNIETRSVSEFVIDGKIKLPRFQRKSTWTAKQNFELAISIFQEYPVGVVILNDEGHTSWLLDGRQRRSALKDLRANPDLVYDWAKKYIKFKPNDSEDEVKNKFWEKVEAYLQKESDDNEDTEEDSNGESLSDSNSIFEGDNDIDKTRQKKGLQTLLDIILMVHQVKNNVGKWERVFDLHDYIDILSYAPKRDDYKVNPLSLRDYLLKYSNQNSEITKESFITYLEDQGGIKSGKEKAFKNEIDKRWDDMSHIIEVISRSEQIYIDARIGVILLRNVTPLDAQNIFSRINSGGTQLKAEELLSAKPFWNEKVNGTRYEMQQLVRNMYERLGVVVPKEGDIVRWDFGATLISRLKDQHLIFEESKEATSPKEIDMTHITLGFKYISSFFAGGMSAVVVNQLEKIKEIQWGRSIDELVDNTNKVCEILLKDSFFRYLKAWHKSLYKLMGSAPVLEFVTILVKDWIDKGCPTVGNDLQNFVRDAKVLFDRLVFEYAIGSWRGSGDSKMASHIKNWKNRLIPLDEKDWETLIESACEGNYNGQVIDIKHLTPILCYQYALQQKMPNDTLDETSEVDHIVPQSKLDNNVMIPVAYKDALFNLMLLPKKDNNAKKDKALNEIVDAFLRSAVSKYSGISESDFNKFSDASNIKELKNKRTLELVEVFTKTRKKELSN